MNGSSLAFHLVPSDVMSLSSEILRSPTFVVKSREKQELKTNKQSFC